MHEFTYLDYIQDVLKDKIIVGEYTRLAVKRHISDLKKSRTKDYPYYFNHKKAKHAIEWFKYCRHVEGILAGETMWLEPFQQFVVGCLFGWVKKVNNKRRFLKAYESVAKKNGKTTKNAGIALYLTGADGEEGSHVYVAATKHKQGAITFNIARQMVQKSKELKSIFNIYNLNLSIPSTGSKFEPLGSGSKGDMDTEDGLNVQGAFIDEYHAHKNRKVYELLDSGTAARVQPLTYMITTAGKDKSVPCYEEEEYAKSILKGVKKNDRYFCIIFGMDEEDLEDEKWKDPKNWAKANPIINTHKYNTKEEIEYKNNFRERLEEQYSKDCESAAGINEFKTKRLNIWTQTEIIWIRDEDYKKCMKLPYDIERLKGRRCYGGLDLSTNIDLTALSFVFPPDDRDGVYEVLVKFFMASETVEKHVKTDRQQYKKWIDDGWILATPGNTIKYDWIERLIYRMSAEYDVRELVYDQWNARDLVTRLDANKVNCVGFSQGWGAISPAAKDFERKILEEKLSFGENPVMRWNVGCATIKPDERENIRIVRPDRAKTGRRIDGVISTAMALDRAVSYMMSIGDDYYEKNEVLII